ncbi:hypothetical protein GCM10009678_76110 [Actinomadura kijaniata]|uniref:DSBA-like thioredoxin domain-containing protein n=1 Tax=Actinomadura namibiensis TaxID=182080 RepID=A0A7W3QS91_ACTNM|nr:hypothetical protein [Actinomadura namibiensis]MBA8957599.1 hypothetical protein [Actinomadura namibiensis]
MSGHVAVSREGDGRFADRLHPEAPAPTRYARGVGFEPWERGNEHSERVTAQRRAGERAGVGGTPTFSVNGMRYEGSYDLAGLSGAVGPALERAAAGPGAALRDRCEPRREEDG